MRAIINGGGLADKRSLGDVAPSIYYIIVYDDESLSSLSRSRTYIYICIRTMTIMIIIVFPSDVLVAVINFNAIVRRGAAVVDDE